MQLDPSMHFRLHEAELARTVAQNALQRAVGDARKPAFAGAADVPPTGASGLAAFATELMTFALPTRTRQRTPA